MPLKPVTLPGERSRAQELYEWLRAAILSGELRPHERLIEAALADLASVSRTPVREALHRLEVDGLVGSGPGGGLEVLSFSLGELSDLCAVRETLEGMAAELAAQYCGDVELASLRTIVAAEHEALETLGLIERRIELNHSFHEVLWRASRNRSLADELMRLRSLIERLQETTLRAPERHETAVAEHEGILAAVAAHDAQSAGDLTRRHFRNATVTRLAMTAASRTAARAGRSGATSTSQDVALHGSLRGAAASSATP